MFELVKDPLPALCLSIPNRSACSPSLHAPPAAAPQVFELVKNSLRAVYDRFEDADEDPPPIRLVVAEGEEDITIKVRQEGAAPGVYSLLFALPAAFLPQFMVLL